MSDETYSFSTAKSRLEDIVTQVRKKDTSLEKSLDLLEEGVRLANACTELIDHADWTGGVPPVADSAQSSELTGESGEDVVDDGAPAELPAVGAAASADASDSDAEFAPDDDAFGDSADEVWADPNPDFADEEADGETQDDA
jgi:exodeoxyribonuclease VII small subunit